MTYYSNAIEIAQKLLSQQGEIIDLSARIKAALTLIDARDERGYRTTHNATLLDQVRAALTEEESRG